MKRAPLTFFQGLDTQKVEDQTSIAPPCGGEKVKKYGSGSHTPVPRHGG